MAVPDRGGGQGEELAILDRPSGYNAEKIRGSGTHSPCIDGSIVCDLRTFN